MAAHEFDYILWLFPIFIIFGAILVWALGKAWAYFKLYSLYLEIVKKIRRKQDAKTENAQ